MTEPLSKIPDGMRYYFGREARVRRAIEETALTVFEGWSYEEITVPTVDYYSLFEQGMGAEARRAFRFMDFDGALLALRPDVTSAVARAAVTLLAKRERPLRFWYVAPVFGQQPRSRAQFRRESTQVGCELFGSNSIIADLEVLMIAREVLSRLDLDRQCVITLNDVEVFNGVVENLALDPSLRDGMRQLVDLRNVADLERFLATFAQPEESRRFAELIQLAGKRDVLDRAQGVMTNERSRAALNRLETLWNIIESLGLASQFEIDLGDVSEMEYYTGLNFKIYAQGAGARVGSGGRYDNLAAKLGHVEPAIGFVLDLDALTNVLLTRPDESAVNGQARPAAVQIKDADAVSVFQQAFAMRAQNQGIIVLREEKS